MGMYFLICVSAWRAQLYVNIVWFFLDALIVFQFLRFGQQAFDELLPKGSLYLFFGASLIVGITREFNNWTGGYSAFGQNLMMSALFVVMLHRRNNVSGQSIYIAIFKMIGTILPSIMFYFRNPESVLFNTLYLSIFALDVLYFALLYAKHKELGLQPWRRF